jgi:protein involved in polysaccharide export with SLBB domain
MRSLLVILLSVYPLICAGQEAESLHIQPGDILRISVRREPDISRSVSVRANGFITMPLVNEIKVAGLSVQQVQTLVVERLQHFVANPEVTVSIEGRVHTHPNFPTLPPLWPFLQAVHPLIAVERAA